MNREPLRILRTHEIRSLACACGDQGDVVLIAAWTGLRFGEFVRLNVADVDLSAQHIRFVGQPKSSQDRTVRLPADLVPVLQHGVIDHEGDEPAIAIPSGARVELARWKRAANWVEAARSIDRSDLRLHELRHAYLAHAIIADVDPPEIRRSMGLAALPAQLGYYADSRDDS